MRILFLGDVVGISGCSKLMNNLLNEIKSNKIDFVIVNGENAASQGVGLTKEICNGFFNCGVDVITTGNHVWDQKEIMEFIDKEERLLRPKNLFEPAPGKGFNIFITKKDINIGVLNLMGNVFMKKCEDVFKISEKFINQYKLKHDYDLLIGSGNSNIFYYENSGNEFSPQFQLNNDFILPHTGKNVSLDYYNSCSYSGIISGISTGGMYFIAIKNNLFGDINSDNILNIFDIIRVIRLSNQT